MVCEPVTALYTVWWFIIDEIKLVTCFSFPDEYEQTSSRYFRHPEDMQFSFGYFYYIMNEEINVSLSQIFKSFDTDESRWVDLLYIFVNSNYLFILHKANTTQIIVLPAEINERQIGNRS